MSHYLRRQIVCERLRLPASTSYRIVGTSYGSLISEDAVVELLNRSRNENQPVLQCLPSDILTPAEVAAIPDIAESGITAHEIVGWTRRVRNPAPCWRLNKQTRRISRSSFIEWLDKTSQIVKRG